ncbi:hypothetical protein G9A89_008671 [Geosiphon pyriformis]|nr:hypothetical protein G9A89_008671 [Geosiphon pyriformis]
MNLVQCEKCREFDYSALECDTFVASPSEPPRTFKRVASDGCCLQLAKLYEKKGVLISYSAAFGGKSWAQVVNDMLLASAPPLPAVDDVVHDFSLSFFKVLISKVGELKLKIVVFEVSISSVLEKLDHLCSETKLRNKAYPWLVDKFDDVYVFSSGLDSGYVGAGVAIVMNRSLAKHADEINSLIAKAMNESFFVIFGGDFNENGFHKCASFRKCYDFGLINSLSESSFAKTPTWSNSWSVAKTIDYVFIFSNLVNAIMQCNVFIVNEHFDSDYKAVFVSLGLGGLLDTRLNSPCKQFNFKSANKIKWNNFKSSTLVNATLFSGKFAAFVRFLNLDAMWCVVHKVMTFSANKIFKKKWFKGFDEVFTKDSSKFYKLELLVSRIVKSLYGEDARNFFYRAFKLTKSLRAKEANIRSAINKKIESFEVNKGHTIRSVLEHPFHKMVLNHLVINDDLILELELVKSKVDVIIKRWTRKHHVADDILIDWCHQYQLLEYVFDEAFSGVMCPIGFNEFFGVIFDLLDSKAAGLSSISNEFWKHCNKSVLNMLLVILNLCLSNESSVLTNTYSIVLIEMAHKILSKIFSNRIFLACKLWLVLQNMRKAYDLMYSKFICFFGNIHNNCTNWVITDFGLTDGYRVHDSLDQEKESICKYRLNSYFIFKNGHAESWAGHSSFFAAGVFVNDMIWVGSSQNTTQYILNVVSEFFQINNILINNDKTVAILINSRISNSSLFISSLPISIAKKEESHQYLGIFLSTKGLSKPSLVKAYSDVCFFTNLVLKKTVLDKQFLYLVLTVFHPIVSYKTQFSFVFVGVYNKWDALICKSLKLKSGLSLDFSNNTIHYPSFYVLQTLAGFWGACSSVYPLVSPACICVDVSNNFLAGMVYILFDCKLSLSGSLASSFQFHGGVSMSVVLALADVGPLDICGSNDFMSVCNHLSQIGINSLSVYTDGLLKNLGMIGCRARAAAFFEDINLGLDVSVQELVLSTLIELQTIPLALECVSVAHSVHLHFVHDVFHAVCHVHWKIGSGSGFLDGDLHSDVDWLCSFRVWHSDLHMATGFTSRLTVDIRTYLIKALHYQFSVAV